MTPDAEVDALPRHSRRSDTRLDRLDRQDPSTVLAYPLPLIEPDPSSEIDSAGHEREETSKGFSEPVWESSDGS
jgi:hypothetical protein